MLKHFIALLLPLVCSNILAVETKRPNILYVMADMERAFSMGCYGDENAKTPLWISLLRGACGWMRAFPLPQSAVPIGQKREDGGRG